MDATSRPSQQLINAQKELARRRQLAGVTYRPPTDSIADCISRNAASSSCSIPHSEFRIPISPPARCSESSSPTTSPNPQSQIPNPKSSSFRIPNPELRIPNPELRIRLSPTLAAHCLNRDHRYHGAALDTPYRLFKILQALDEHGRGWLANSDIEPLLTKKESAFYIYGRRQLKIILRRGEGLFWQRVKSRGQVRIRLTARARVVEALDCGRLRGREVELPLSYMLGAGRGRQAGVNAALYAAVHAGRFRPDTSPSGISKPRPISRAKLQELAGCSNYRQRSYERRMKISVEHNIHILGAHSSYDLERARQHLGLPAYKHTDYQGKINRHKRGAAYIAVRLPNSYHLPDAITVVQSRRQRTINRFLDGLCHLGSGGSDREEIVRLYHRDIATAVRAGQGDQSTPAYWPIRGSGIARLWQNHKVTGESWQGCAEQIHNPKSAFKRG